MSLLLGILAFFVILGILILVHEVGHFTGAKLFGVRVEEFGLGFPPRVRSIRRGETLYSLNAIPLGGFVRMTGENGEAHDPHAFGAKAPWKRLMILLAGPSMNILLAVAIFFAVYINGYPRGVTVITGVSPHSPATTAGLRRNDVITAVDGTQVRYLDEVQQLVATRLGHRMTLKIVRKGTVRAITLVPRKRPPANQGPIGITMGQSTTVAYSPAHALQASVGQVGAMVQMLPTIVQSIGQHNGSSVTGPIGIAHITTRVVKDEPQTGPSSLFQFIALLSANLGVLNLLPIPALDGGRIVFVLLSWVRRRNLDPEVEGVIHMVGMALLLLLIVVVSYQDIVRWIGGGSF